MHESIIHVDNILYASLGLGKRCVWDGHNITSIYLYKCMYILPPRCHDVTHRCVVEAA